MTKTKTWKRRLCRALVVLLILLFVPSIVWAAYPGESFSNLLHVERTGVGDSQLIVERTGISASYLYVQRILGMRLWYQPNTIVSSTKFAGTVDSGTTTTLVDAELTQADAYWNLARLIITDTTDDLAPKGEHRVVTSFVASTDTLNFAAMTAAPGAGDTYTVEFGTLVDRTGYHDGRITWGVNTNLGVTIGSTTSYSSTTAAGETGEAGIITPAAEPENWYVTGATMSNLPFYEQFNDAATATGMTTQTLYLMMMLGISAAVGLGVLLFTGSALIAAIVTGSVMLVEVGTSVIGMWMVYIFAILAIGLLYLSRQT